MASCRVPIAERSMVVSFVRVVTAAPGYAMSSAAASGATRTEAGYGQPLILTTDVDEPTLPASSYSITPSHPISALTGPEIQ
jgi:hypothetical protein